MAMPWPEDSISKQTPKGQATRAKTGTWNCTRHKYPTGRKSRDRRKVVNAEILEAGTPLASIFMETQKTEAGVGDTELINLGVMRLVQKPLKFKAASLGGERII